MIFRARTLPPILVLVLLAAVVSAQRGRRDGPPRRLADPQTIHLDAGSRVEFRTFEAPSLQRTASYSVMIPAAYEREPGRRFPVIYFLHGLNNDHTSWVTERYGHLPQQLEDLMQSGAIPEALLVHPDGESGLYTNSLDGSVRWEDFVHKDLMTEVESTFRTRSDRAGRAIGGVSMGAYGALKIGLKHPQTYGAAAGVSPIVLLGEDPSEQMAGSNSRMAGFMGQLFQPVFGIPFDRDHWSANSLEALAARVPLEGLRLYFAYGTADRYSNVFPMEEGIRTLDGILSEREAGHVFKVYAGEPHGWELVSLHLEEVLGFLGSQF